MKVMGLSIENSKGFEGFYAAMGDCGLIKITEQESVRDR